MRAPHYNVAIRGDVQTIKALFSRRSQLPRSRKKEKRERTGAASFDVPRHRSVSSSFRRRANRNEDESKPFR